MDQQRFLDQVRQALEARSGDERRLYRELPAGAGELLELFDLMVPRGDRYFRLVAAWIKRKRLYGLECFPSYERWLHGYVNRWGICDVFCYWVLNPMVERHPQLFANVMAWTESPRTYVRRAAPVCLLESTQSFRVNCEIHKVLLVAEKLKQDPHQHVRQAVGWLLKYAYLAYPDQMESYLRDNAANLPRTVFRYAVEKTPPAIRRELMSLPGPSA